MSTDNSDSYKYLRYAHMAAVCFGLPYTRKKIKKNCDRHENTDDLAGQYRYSFDKRLIPVWTFYACLNAYVVYYNYVEGVRYVGESFKVCFEESYCFALIELLNRNIGPSSNVWCSMFYGRRSKNVGLAGTERTLRFLDETRELAASLSSSSSSSDGQLSRLVMVFSPASLFLYLTFSHFYMSMVAPAIVIVYWANGMGQMVVYMLVFIQYYVLERGFARVNVLVETAVGRHGRGAGDALESPSLERLADTYDELCALVDHVNRAYAPEMLLQWLYNIVRVIMVVFRLLEIASSLDGPLASVTSFLIVEHVGELFMFILHTTCMCTVGERLSRESKKILASLEKLRHRNHNGLNTNMEIKKSMCICYVRANARNVYASIGGFIIFDMALIKCVCSVLITYVLVLIQFRDQKGNSKPLYHNWN